MFSIRLLSSLPTTSSSFTNSSTHTSATHFSSFSTLCTRRFLFSQTTTPSTFFLLDKTTTPHRRCYTSSHDNDDQSVSEISQQKNDGFAVVTMGSSQYKVVVGDRIMVDKIDGPDIGDELLLEKVMLFGTPTLTAIGRPLLSSCQVLAQVEEQTKTEKVMVFKKKRRKGYKRRRGFRSDVTVLRIKALSFDPTKEQNSPTTVIATHSPQSIPSRVIEYQKTEAQQQKKVKAAAREKKEKRRERRTGVLRSQRQQPHHFPSQRSHKKDN
mmetsp:Transcript_16821/g.25125  ORF Transcript_16821/g.25125 Transcript_16821/m.25125 type:complete len:268 (+) Transcript_16821:17-820(+)